jgi:hypothetical protein
MMTTDETISVISRPAIVVNSRGVINLPDICVSSFKDSEEACPFSQEFPEWPCHSLNEYEASFNALAQTFNLNLEELSFTEVTRLMINKIRVLEKTTHANLLAGPCLPIIQPQTGSLRYYKDLLEFFWDKMTGVCYRKSKFLTGELMMHDLSEFQLPLRSETFRVRLIFPQALPPLSIEDMKEFARSLKFQYQLSVAGPLDMLCAMAAYPKIFNGNFRLFFPDFSVVERSGGIISAPRPINGRSKEEDGGLTLFIASNRRTLSFNVTDRIDPKIFDFCPIMF